jgi:hypothetical protein
MEAADLHGSWQLQNFAVTRADGSIIFPYGKDARGTLLYTPSGWVSADLCRQDRGESGAITLESGATATNEQRLRAFDGYTSYSGRYEIKDPDSARQPHALGQTPQTSSPASHAVIVHRISVALLPAMVGQKVIRNAQLMDGLLTLNYTVASPRGIDRYELLWTRA